MLPLWVHIQLTLLSWPVLTTHSVSKENTMSDTRFWWAKTHTQAVLDQQQQLFYSAIHLYF